jgi:Trk K+ transport system NAD-binding subunit
MKILFLTNGTTGYNLVDWLVNQDNNIITIYTHKLNLDIVEQIKPDFIISYNYIHIIK